MEKIVLQALLYDFYGELLNDHQKSIYEDYVFNDIGLSEIASERGISRQGVHDLIKRCNKILEGYEEKLHLVEKFEKTKTMVMQIRNLSDEYLETENTELIGQIKDISSHILDEI